MRTAKQIIVVRTDLGMRRGKECAQAAHASMAWLTSRLQQTFDRGVDVYMESEFTPAELDWIQGLFMKIVCRVDSEEELLAIHERAKAAGLTSHLIEDAGRTEFKEPTHTAVGIGPDRAEKLDPVTGDLKLY